MKKSPAEIVKPSGGMQRYQRPTTAVATPAQMRGVVRRPTKSPRSGTRTM